MSSSGIEKVCVMCGEDCSNKPRTKDAKGRYYCKECHEQATHRAGAMSAPDGQFALPLEDVVPPPIIDTERSAMPTSCPNCGRAMRAGATQCSNCGFNVQLGYRAETPSPIASAVKKSVPWFFSPLYLFIKPATFFRNFVNSPPALTALFAWVFGMAGMIDRVQTRIALSQASGRPVPFTANWAEFWIMVTIGGILAGALFYSIGGWWYGVRIRWSGVKNSDRKLVRRVYVLASMVYACPLIAATLIDTARYASPITAWHGNFTIVELLVIVCLFWSIWNSFVGVRTVFQTKVVPSVIWFLVLPVGFYATILFGAMALAVFLLSAPPNVSNPSAFSSSTVRFNYPSNWIAGNAAQSFDAEACVSVEPAIQDAYMEITVYEPEGTLEEELESFVDSLRAGMTSTREQATFANWGRFSGAGQELVGTSAGDRYRVRVFVGKVDERRAMVVYEICSMDIVDVVEPGFNLVRSTMTVR